jgi:hypothetical protein
MKFEGKRGEFEDSLQQTFFFLSGPIHLFSDLEAFQFEV